MTALSALGANVPTIRIFSGDSGLPLAVVKASHTKPPEFICQLPGSSQIAQGQSTKPIAVLPLLPMIRSRVCVPRCVIPMRVGLSV